MDLAAISSELAPAMPTGFSPLSGDRSDIAAANAKAMDCVRRDEFFDGWGDQSAEEEQVVLERLLLSSLVTDGADQR